MDWLNSIPATLMQKDLDGLWQRQQAISDNIANVETPGYKSKTVSFEDQLQHQLSSGEGTTEDTVRRLQDTGTVTAVSKEESARLDGNNVDIEKENTELARTQLNYLYSLRELSDYFSRLKYAISEGKS